MKTSNFSGSQSYFNANASIVVKALRDPRVQDRLLQTFGTSYDLYLPPIKYIFRKRRDISGVGKEDDQYRHLSSSLNARKGLP